MAYLQREICVRTSDIQAEIESFWDEEVIPVLAQYIKIPCLSPAFDRQWAQSGELDAAADLLAQWTQHQLAEIPHASVEVIRVRGLTPSLYVEVPGNGELPVLIYGHLDKQPAMDGWAEGRGAWTPTMEGERLYGRGGADDGYALFSAITAILILRRHALPHPPVQILIEGSEESGSPDLDLTLDHLGERLGTPSLLVALDAGCGNYEQLWLTTSLRGQVAGTLKVSSLLEGVHSGDASGVVPSSFRIARDILSRIEDPASGEVADPLFNAEIPADRLQAAAEAGAVLGSGVFTSFPVQPGLRPATGDPSDQLLNRSWRPQLTVPGLSGLPAVEDAAAVLRPNLSLKISLRLPPTVDAKVSADRLKSLLEADPPYGALVDFNIDMISPGWNAPPVKEQLQKVVNSASARAFGRPAASMGGGGGIPFLSMLGERFPEVQFLVTGVLGPQSNAHGPNEFLHVPSAKRLTASLAYILHDLGAAQ